MKSKMEDPALWIDKLKVINKRLASIDRQFEKGDSIKMMSHIMAKKTEGILGSDNCLEGQRNR
jgi:hypothetical protein